jgi:hypothetical protein
LARFEFESRVVLFCSSFIFVSFGESCLLVLWCAGGRCSMAGDLVQRTRDGRTGRVLSGRAVERSGGIVCGLQLARAD